jgi:predicted nucleotidyltransferase
MQAIDARFGDNIEAAYLCGSAVMGGLKPHSDLDFLVVLTRATTPEERLALIASLASISHRELRPASWRPIELTTIVMTDGRARLDFQYGEWLREDFAAGRVEPAERAHVDLPIVIAMAREMSVPLIGAAVERILAPVPLDALRAAMIHGIPDLLNDLEADTANVLLTLARILSTLATNSFMPKDAAADWVIRHDGDSEWRALNRARDVYTGAQADEWSDMQDEAATEADRLVHEIGARWLQSDSHVDQISWR